MGTKIELACFSPILRPSTDGVWARPCGLQPCAAKVCKPSRRASAPLPGACVAGDPSAPFPAGNCVEKLRRARLPPVRTPDEASQSSPVAVPRRYCDSARLRSDAFFVRNVARHGAGSHRHQRSAVSTIFTSASASASKCNIAASTCSSAATIARAIARAIDRVQSSTMVDVSPVAGPFTGPCGHCGPMLEFMQLFF